MRFSCDSCQARYTIADEKLRGKILRVRCKRCGSSILLKEPDEDDLQEPLLRDVDATHVVRVDEIRRTLLDPETDGDDDSGLKFVSRSSRTPPSGPAPAAPTEPPPARTEPPAPPPEKPQWFVLVNKEEIGPLRMDDLRERARAGTLTLRTYAWRDGLGNWDRLANIAELKGVADLLPGRAAPPPAPPPPSAKARQPLPGAVAPVKPPDAGARAENRTTQKPIGAPLWAKPSRGGRVGEAPKSPGRQTSVPATVDPSERVTIPQDPNLLREERARFSQVARENGPTEPAPSAAPVEDVDDHALEPEIPEASVLEATPAQAEISETHAASLTEPPPLGAADAPESTPILAPSEASPISEDLPPEVGPEPTLPFPGLSGDIAGLPGGAGLDAFEQHEEIFDVAVGPEPVEGGAAEGRAPPASDSDAPAPDEAHSPPAHHDEPEEDWSEPLDEAPAYSDGTAAGGRAHDLIAASVAEALADDAPPPKLLAGIHSEGPATNRDGPLPRPTPRDLDAVLTHETGAVRPVRLALRGADGSEPPESAPPRPRAPRDGERDTGEIMRAAVGRRRVGLLVGIVIAIVVVGGAVGYFLLRDEPAPPEVVEAPKPVVAPPVEPPKIAKKAKPEPRAKTPGVKPKVAEEPTPEKSAFDAVQADMSHRPALGDLPALPEDPDLNRPSATQGGVDEVALKKQISHIKPGITSCVNAALRRTPDLRVGKVKVSLVVGSSGMVTTVGFDKAAFASTELGQCITGRVKSMVLPAFEGDPQPVEFPLTITASE